MINLHAKMLALILGYFITSPNAFAGAVVDSMRSIEGDAIVGFLNSIPADLSAGKLLVIDGKSTSDNTVNSKPADVKQQMMEASDSVITDFLRVNRKQVVLNLPTQLIRTDLHYKIVGSERLKQIFEKSKLSLWANFHREFPGATGVLEFSRAGFDERSGQALIFYSFSCGALCGTGNLVLLQRELTGWRIVNEVMVWIS